MYVKTSLGEDNPVGKELIMIGIYKITNKVNYKVYIGQSINIEERWKHHKLYYSNKKLKEYNTKFYRAIRKYGIENFDFEIIEECPIELLNEREKYWIYILKVL